MSTNKAKEAQQMRKTYATQDKRRGELYKRQADEKTGLEVLAQGSKVTLDASRAAIKAWCDKKGFTFRETETDKKTGRTFFYTDAKRFFIHDALRQMLLSD